MAGRAVKFVGGLPETACGAGSTMANTVSVRAALPELVRDLGIRRVLDAPCGDCNWISTVDLPEYIGCDINDENLAVAKARGMNVIHRDVVNDPLPDADLMICRDFHQHLPTSMVMKALAGFKRSGIRWLLATSHDVAGNDDCELGGFRPINLTARPFSLPPPERQIEDGRGRILGLWHRDTF